MADGRAALAKVLPTAANIHLHVIMTDRTLFGVCDEPADLAGYGPIPAPVARALAAAELGPNATTWIRKFYTNPATGQLAATEARARRFPTVLREFLLVRDRVCRTPYCHAPGRHHDHQRDHADGGPTSLVNGQLTCESCDHTKQAPGWTVTTRPDGVIETSTPTGHQYESPPPTPPASSTTAHPAASTPNSNTDSAASSWNTGPPEPTEPMPTAPGAAARWSGCWLDLRL